MTFLHMGGYALYVWPCYIISAVTLVVLYLQSWRRLKVIERELSRAEAARGGRRSLRAGEDAAEGSLS